MKKKKMPYMKKKVASNNTNPDVFVQKVQFEDGIPWDKVTLGKQVLSSLTSFLYHSSGISINNYLSLLPTLKIKYSDTEDYYGEYLMFENTIVLTKAGCHNNDYLINTLVHEMFHVLSFEKEIDCGTMKSQVFGEALTELFTLEALKKRFPSVYSLPSYSFYLFPTIVITKILGVERVKNAYSTGKISQIPNLANNELLLTLIMDCIGAMESLFDFSNIQTLNQKQHRKLDENLCLNVYKRAIDVLFFYSLFDGDRIAIKKFNTKCIVREKIIKEFPMLTTIVNNFPCLSEYIDNKIITHNSLVQDSVYQKSIDLALSNATTLSAWPSDPQRLVDSIITSQNFEEIKNIPSISRTDAFYSTLLKSASYTNNNKIVYKLLLGKNGLIPCYEKNDIIVSTILSIAERDALGIFEYIPSIYKNNQDYLNLLIDKNPGLLDFINKKKIESPETTYLRFPEIKSTVDYTK